MYSYIPIHEYCREYNGMVWYGMVWYGLTKFFTFRMSIG